jgi:chemotaxis methyl-accepting protein methylase
VRVWAAGCSNGLEVYSIALIFAELRALHRISLLGTDFRQSAVTAAREARFTERMMLSVPDSYSRYFFKNGCDYTIAPEIRNRVRFEQDDVFARRPSEQFDMILCRNMVVYLQPDASRRLWKQLIDAVKPHGLLVTGRAERIDLASVARLSPCIYQKKESVIR